MHIGNGAADGGGATGWQLVEGLHKTHEDVRTGWTELDEERRLVGLDPGIDDMFALNGGSLYPSLYYGAMITYQERFSLPRLRYE